jgi:hypothetical protein
MKKLFSPRAFGHMLNGLAFCFALLPTIALAQFTDIGAGLTGVDFSSVAWGDYDNDGDLDILLTGFDGVNSLIAKVYRNTGGIFSDIGAGLAGVDGSSVAWGDYDNDGDLDILLTGSYIAQVYQNTAGVFTDISASLTGVRSSSAAWGDYDNDGDLDILLTGEGAGSACIAKVYQNTAGVFTDISASLTGVRNSSVAWGDYDNDGDLDILLTGEDAGFNFVAKVYQNTAGVFTDIGAGLTGVRQSSVAWGDYDNDGDLDILLAGFVGGVTRTTKVYRNSGSGFTDIGAGLTGVDFSSVAWGDYDNDGDLDILLTGDTGGLNPIAKVYQNTGSGFTDIGAGLTGVLVSSVGWGDYDNDGDLDILLTGLEAGRSSITKVYQNTSTVFNTVPSAPTNLSESVNGNSVTFSWNASTDAQTPSAGLTYNLMVGTSSNGIEVAPPMANVSNGYRRVARLGGTNHNESWTIKNLSDGNYFWRVQAVDAAFAGSPFSAEGTFEIMTCDVTADAGVDASVCFNASVNLDGTPGGGDDTYTFSWSVFSGPDLSGTQFNSTTVEDPTFTPSTSGTYVLTFTVDDGTCPIASDDVQIIVNPSPGANAGADRTICLGETIALGGNPTASGGTPPYAYSWTASPADPSLTTPTVAAPKVRPVVTTTYMVEVTDAKGCIATDYVTITVLQFVFHANKVTLKSTKQVPSYGDIHSNGLLIVEKGYPSTYNSNLTAIGKITINKQNTINGNVKSQTSISNSGTINGTKTVGPVANESLPSLSYSAGGANKTVPNGGSLTLAPGSYGIVTMSQGGTLKLTSGEYFMNELRYASTIEGGTIEIDLSSGDPVTINVVSNLQFGHEAAVVLLPNGESDSELVTFNTLQSTAANWGREGYFIGSFNAPNAIVTLEKNSQLRGSICAKEILVSNDCLFLHHDSPGSLPGPGNLPKAAVDEDEEATSNEQPVTSYQLEQNYPNPFNPSTVISFQLPVNSEVTLSLFNTNGQLVKKLVAGEMNAGRHSLVWDATNERGERVASGVYLYVIKAGEFTAQRKLVLMK